MRYVVCVLMFALGCASPTAPVELACTNAMFTNSFRLVVRADTTPWLANRYVIPHRSADTFPISGGRLIIGAHPFNGRCFTLYDSLWFHSPEPKQMILPIGAH